VPVPLTNEQLRDAFALVDKIVECHARLPGATDDAWRAHLESSMTECARKIRAHLESADRSEWAERLAFETDTINCASQHDLVLFVKVTASSALTFTWRAKSRIIGPRFDERELAIDWMRDWLDENG
jgi:hypothetical protein